MLPTDDDPGGAGARSGYFGPVLVLVVAVKQVGVADLLVGGVDRHLRRAWLLEIEDTHRTVRPGYRHADRSLSVAPTPAGIAPPPASKTFPDSKCGRARCQRQRRSVQHEVVDPRAHGNGMGGASHGRRAAGHGLSQRHPRRAGRGDREHLPRRHAQARTPPRLRGARSLLGRFRSGDGDRGAQQLPLDPIGHVRPHQVFGTRYMRRLPRGHGNGAHFGRHRPAPETAAADGTDERVILSLPGGGGFGAPTERVPARVARDATDGLVSVERAREVYGIVLTESGQHGERAADTEATGRLREEVTAHPKKDP